MATQTYVNANGQTVAQDANGAWRRVNAAGEPKGAFAAAPTRPSVAPPIVVVQQPAAAAPPAPPPPPVPPVVAVAPPPPPRPPAPPVVAVAPPPSPPPAQPARNWKGPAAIAAVFVALALLGVYFLRGENTTTAGISERRIADIAGATFDQRIKPLTDDVAKLQSKSSDLANGLATLDTKVGKVEDKVMAGIKDVLDRLNKTSGPNTSSVTGSVEAKRLAQLKTECLPKALDGIDVKDSLTEVEFQAYLKVCRAEKEQAIRQAQQPAPSSPQVAARQSDAQSDDEGDEPAQSDDAEGTGAVRTGRYDSRTASAMDPAVTQAGYQGGPHYGRPQHHGARRGTPSCRNWPGFRMNPANGRCEQTRGRDGNVVQYDRPGSNDCRPGEATQLQVPLPNGGIRTINMRCRSDGRRH